MNAALKQAAEQYGEGLITADEFLGRAMQAIGKRWQVLHAEGLFHDVETDALSRVISELEA